MQVVGGVGEVAVGVAVAGIGSAATLGAGSPVAIAGGVVIGAHGLDQIQSALRGTESYAAQAGGAIVGSVLGQKYAWIGSVVGDMGLPDLADLFKHAKQLGKFIKDLDPATAKAFFKKLFTDPKELRKALDEMSPEEIARRLEDGSLTKEQLEAAGLDPSKFERGAKSSVEAAQATADGSVGIATNEPPRLEVIIDGSKHPESARHAQDGIDSGISPHGEIDRPGSKPRRNERMDGVDPIPGMDRDEFPPAVFKPSTGEYSVRGVPPSDNRGAGAAIGNQISGHPDGTPVTIKVINVPPKEP
ncbi:MAG: NucA/NucB deoxyribonuclease domain-containing protein [Planctomycetota bacterium]|nr:NucA/NucB deoxyribonuclease domain-containing protein [Planctomycetota bacterium]